MRAAEAKAGEGKRKYSRPMASSKYVRPDYHRQPILTYAECALIAGVTATKVRQWVYAEFIPMANRRGAYRIRRDDLDKFLKTGQPV